MHIVITGGAGFLGARLARSLLARGTLSLTGEPPRPIERIYLIDRAVPPGDLLADARVQVVAGDLLALLREAPDRALPAGTAIVFHLAAAVSGECEADFDLGLQANLHATMALLEACRAMGTAPVVVFSSSLAVFGTPLPDVVCDHTLPTPNSSYGIQKFIGEQLVADYTRKGFVRGRSVRLMTVSVRPGKPNGAASSFLSGMVREPLAGERGTCPVPPDTPVALASPGNTVAGLLRAAEASDAEWGPRTAVNLPALHTSPRAMAEALAQVAGDAVAARIDWTHDERIALLVQGWPGRVDAARAAALGLGPDTDYASVLHAYIQENPHAVAEAGHP